METLDTASRQSVGLPSINHLDAADKVKREEVDYQRKYPTAAMVSPLHPFAGPSHLHANHQSSPASAVSASLGGLLSPPESRRTSGDEKESQRPTARQSLPSIHEALGTEQPLSFPAPVQPTSALAPVHQHYLPLSATSSPSDQRIRNFPPDFNSSQGPTNPFSHPRSPFLGTSISQPPPPPPQTQPEPLPRPSFAAPQHNPKLPTLHPLKTTQSPPMSVARPNMPYPSYPPPPSTYENPAPQSAGPMNQHYSYSQYPPSYPLSAPSVSAPNSAYPPSTSTYSAPPRYPPQPWRDNSEMVRLEDKKINRASLAPYGESVKRHLESFDLEASLNEMADGSGRIGEFSKVYRQRAHENQRIGMTPQSMPRLEEVDDMLKQSERIQMSLQRMRDVVLNNHQASMVEPPRDPYRQMNGYDHDGLSNYGDDGKSVSGFAGGDNKSRKRGVSTSFAIWGSVSVNACEQRAAPPGRCHSCNRAETPEWRRGPDGARTLCNACGLHYAKLTRKMGGKQAMTSSNLRPKSLDHGSPAM
ncbi:uncharacterized protein K460DRAFT_91359 [Cucurbitaria berberidis CBS 394.84]|uniref:GATA-type domain-containing protein n=1 Tax=Cucurbitaria berberidis CBS 394.84 TaxID=1168544 RepID=A0A9P4GQU9_9PLEO|nr:uncharacterized protein K460DRAFT_91359 [Cucurbitaria berberidis CBS 394.84]KAF1849461.1 hypothetical protein K460DRAFT_91359 [Cucurbitaria berberidis CBS 394.84]